MTRLPDIKRSALNPDQTRAWERIFETRGSVSGPYEVLVRIPALAERVAELGNYFHQNTLLGAADRELAILAAAREIGSRYQWSRHEALARKSGVRPEAIECLRQMQFNHLAQRELVIVEIVQSLFRTKIVPQSLFEKALQELGEDVLVELVTLSGFYCAIAFIITAFDVSMTDSVDPSF